MQASDGVRLRAVHWRGRDPTALAVLLSGRTEFIEKMAVPAAELVDRGYQVVSVDWRGQGLSDRLADPGAKGHVDGFAEYQRDLDALLASPPVADHPGPRLLIAHSMGGAIATGAMLRPDVAKDFAALVLSAPMYGIAMSAPMRVAAGLTVRIGRALGKTESWPPFGDPAVPYVLTEPDENILTNDAAIWDWLVATATDHPELNLGMPTLGWFDAAKTEMARLGRARPLGLPALGLLGSAEAVVDPKAVVATCRRLRIKLVKIDGARHEHLVESAPLRAEAWQAIDRFLVANNLPAVG